ncbi:MAG: hypothetical protein WB491_14685 [Candidatus Aquilonibacter sp.]
MNVFRRYLLFATGLGLAVALAIPTHGAASTNPYERMAPLSQYLMSDRQAEIALARSAAPPSISEHATVLVLSTHGYETADTGSNGFTCLVERGWTAPFDFAQFWNWKIRGPICYNEAASRTVLTYTIRRTQMVLAGLTNPEMLARTRAAVASGQLPLPALGSMCYMMSKAQYLGDGNGNWMPHIMIYASKAAAAHDGAGWGADLRGSPVVYDSRETVLPEPETIFMVPVAHWSDGTAAPQM